MVDVGHLVQVAANTAVSAIVGGGIALAFAWIKLSPMWQEHRTNQRKIIQNQEAILRARGEETPPA